MCIHKLLKQIALEIWLIITALSLFYFQVAINYNTYIVDDIFIRYFKLKININMLLRSVGFERCKINVRWTPIEHVESPLLASQRL